jgi:hypothetical protein
LPGDAELNRRLRTDFSLGDAAMYNVVSKDLNGARAEVGDLQITRKRGTGDDSDTTTVTQSAAFFTVAGLRVPHFFLQPEGTLLKLFARLMGSEKIEFPAQPYFSQIYDLSGTRPDNTRRLFDDGVLNRLVRRPGLRIQSAADALLIYEPGRQFEAAELEAFIAEATQIFRLFEASARRMKQEDESRVTPKEDVRALAEKMPGLMGNILRETLVTRSDLSAFVSQATPRKIPANILRYVDNFAPGFVMLIGIMFSVAGTGFAVAFGYEALASGKGLMSDKGMGTLFGLVFLGVGSCIAYFAGRARFRMNRLLRDGRICPARIEKIDSTNMSINNKAVSLMTVQFQAEGRITQASCKIMGDAIQRAQKFVVDEKPAPILYDPADPQRILLVDALLNVSPEYEQ